MVHSEPLRVRGDVCVEEQPLYSPSDEACRMCGAAGRRVALTEQTVAGLDSILSRAHVSFLSVCTQCLRRAQPSFTGAIIGNGEMLHHHCQKDEGAVVRR